MMMIIAFFCLSIFSSLNSLSIEKIVESQRQWTLNDDYFTTCFASGLENLSGRTIALMLASWEMIIKKAKDLKEPVESFYQRASLFHPKIEAFFSHPLNEIHFDTQILLKNAFFNDNLAQIFLKAHKLGFEKKDLHALLEIIQAIAGPEKGNRIHSTLKKLYYAAYSGHCRNIERAIESGTPINSVISTDGTTALMHTAKNNFTKAAKILLRHPNLNINAQTWNSNHPGSTALHFAIMNGNSRMCKLILAHKKLIINIQDDFGNSALMLAARSDRADLIELILSYFPSINLRLKNQDGNRALDLAQSNFVRKILIHHFHSQKSQILSKNLDNIH